MLPAQNSCQTFSHTKGYQTCERQRKEIPLKTLWHSFGRAKGCLLSLILLYWYVERKIIYELAFVLSTRYEFYNTVPLLIGR